MQRVALGHIDISDGVIHLVKILSIVVVGSHTLQLAYHLLAVVLGQHLGLSDACIELEFVWRTAADNSAESLVCLLLIAHQIVYLTKQIQLACLLHLAFLVLDGLLQIWYRLGVFGCTNVVVGVGIVPILNGTKIHRVATHIANHVLSIVSPIKFGVALSQPSSSQSAHQWLTLIQSGHIRECGSSLFELSHLELRLTHHKPCFPQKRILLLTFLLDAMAMDGFLHLFDRSLIVRLAYLATGLIANGIEWYQFGVVILVALLLFQIAVDKGLMTIIIGIIAGIECVPEA